MATFTTNSNASYKPTPFQSSYYMEMLGTAAASFAKSAEWVKVAACDVLKARSSDDMEADKTYPTFVYKGTAGGQTVGLILGPRDTPYRVFNVDGEDGFTATLQNLQANKGFLEEQAVEVDKVYSGNDAQALYAWESRFFGESSLFSRMHANELTKGKAKKKTDAFRAEPCDIKEAMEIIKTIAKRYDVYNVEVTFGATQKTGNGMTLLGQSTPWDGGDSIPHFGRPFGIRIFLAESVLMKHTVVHEMTHGIQQFKYGLTAHGKAFRSLYRLLLRQNLGVTPEGL